MAAFTAQRHFGCSQSCFMKLGKYKGIEIDSTQLPSREVDEMEVFTKIFEMRTREKKAVTAENRSVEEGDVAIIDFEGFVDGAAFEGGKGEKFPLEIGSSAFIPGFEEQIIGHFPGEEFDVNVKFPDVYVPTLAGKDAVFKIKLIEVQEYKVPELDDEFVKSVSQCESVEEYKKMIADDLSYNKNNAYKDAVLAQAMSAIYADSEMDELPEDDINAEVEARIDQLAQQLTQQGLTLEKYFEFTGMTKQDLVSQIRPDVEATYMNMVILDGIIEAENIKVTDEELEAEFEKMASMYNMDIEKLKGLLGDESKDAIAHDYSAQKALSLIVDSVVFR